METRNSEPKAAKLLARAFYGAMISIAAVACSHNRHDYSIEGPGFARVYTPQVPTFMLGPAGALLTNSPGYVARATVQGEPSTIEG